MKKVLLLTLVGALITSASAFGHCGSCGVGETAEHEHKDKAECKADCTKACCAEKDKEAGEEACEEKEKKAEGTETAAAPAGACCPAGKSSKPA